MSPTVSKPTTHPYSSHSLTYFKCTSHRDKGHPAPFDSTFSEYKFGHLKKKLSRDVNFPKTLSLEFARTLLSNKGATITMQTESNLMLGGQLEGSTVCKDDDNASRGSNTSSITGIGSFDLPSVPLPRLQRTASMAKSMRFSLDMSSGSGEDGKAIPTSPSKSFILTRANTAASLASDPAAAAAHAAAAAAAIVAGKSPALQRSKSTLSVKTKATTASSTERKVTIQEDLDDLEDLISESEQSQRREISKELTAIDFFRICALCEMRFPRSAVDFKVVRKHIVQLRSSWDPHLVSKEVRSLDNTISMYNLYYVCVFCSQFFDPDFPDGIAYPTRTKGKQSTGNRIADALATEDSTALTPYYDRRHQPNAIEVGDVFKRPRTVESRRRAKRALAVAQEMADKQRAMQELIAANDETASRVST